MNSPLLPRLKNAGRARKIPGAGAVLAPALFTPGCYNAGGAVMNESPNDRENLQKFERWSESPAGEFALCQRRALAEQLIAGWSRRGRSILEVGCGSGYFLEAFWEAGLDISGLDSSPEHLNMARQRLGGHVDLVLGQPEHLPFDKEEFDYVAVLSPLGFSADPDLVLREAFQVAKRGVLIGFYNKHSLHRLSCFYHPENCSFHALHWQSCVRMLALAKRSSGGLRGSLRSTLLGPPGTWEKGGLWRKINSSILPTPFGAYVALRVDLAPGRCVTPLCLSTPVTAG